MERFKCDLNRSQFSRHIPAVRGDAARSLQATSIR